MAGRTGGGRVSADYNIVTTLTMLRSLYERVAVVASKSGKSFQEIVRQALQDYLARVEQAEKG